MISMLVEIAQANSWKPSIGDPTLMGWTTVIAYFITAVLCVFCAFYANARFKSPYRRKLRIFWWSVAGVIIALGINKQLDLQSLLTIVVRNLSKEWGWYEYRREFQKIFLLVLVGAGTLITFLTTFRLRDIWRHHKLAITGLIALMLFVIGRASSFHHIDQLINFELLGVRMNWVLELGGIFCIAIAAIIKLHQFLLERRY